MPELRTIRRVAVILSVLALIYAIVAAARLGLADLYAAPAQSYLAARSDAALAGGTPLALTDEELSEIGTNLARARVFTPDDPELLSWLGRLYLYRLVPDDLSAQEILEYGDSAAAHFEDALAARPTWPWDWMNLATAKYEQFHDTSHVYHTGLVRSMQFGAAHPTIQTAVAELGLDSWEALSADASEAVLQAIESALEREDRLLVELAEIAEVWTPVCPRLAGAFVRILAVCARHDLT